jgi:hypothetical protein
VKAKGSKASGTGRVLEQTVVSVLREKKFKVVNYLDWKRAPKEYGQELLLKHVPFTTIYDHPGTTEFLLKSAEHGLTARIECKWQQSPGSVDEKLPYLYLNAIERVPEEHIIIVIDGDGWKKGAIPWLREAVAKKKYTNEMSSKKRIEVVDMKGFITWANNTFTA